MSKQDWKDFFHIFIVIPGTVAAYAYVLCWALYIFGKLLPWPTLLFSGV